jgi:outer membrane biosynthesis protein TonB
MTHCLCHAEMGRSMLRPYKGEPKTQTRNQENTNRGKSEPKKKRAQKKASPKKSEPKKKRAQKKASPKKSEPKKKRAQEKASPKKSEPKKRQTQDPHAKPACGAPKPKSTVPSRLRASRNDCATTSRGWRAGLFHRAGGHRCRAWLRRVLRWLRERLWRPRNACWP